MKNTKCTGGVKTAWEQIMKFLVPPELFRKPEFLETTHLPPSRFKFLQMVNGPYSSVWRNEATIARGSGGAPQLCSSMLPSLVVGRSQHPEGNEKPVKA